ncbi:protein-tyrosine-phosphatase [Rhizocola hellebori]|uniref:protein-tyrosine-phosphatase n=1 Tax=Rhizocola hellebori TaxID=1392758 RepID=A0A8J3VML1_9ACTN|nr:tyrosine-protein phosphatase [Rhizocola hellebori]GIH11381.1 protein-tyrosine-phosphatase [Rhizocola hellebori]
MERHLKFERLHNFRDLGGYPAADGRQVRWGQLYRSDNLGKLKGDDLQRFSELDIRTVIDLRYPFEIEARGRVPEADGLAYHNLSIEHRPYWQADVPADVDTVRFLADRYLEVAEDGVLEIRQALEILASEDNAPAVFHCAAGKDRTGLIAALVLSLLGVSEADIVADFALTGLSTERTLADFLANHPERTYTWPDYGKAPAAVMELFLAELKAKHGSVHSYVTDVLGVDEKTIAALRLHLLTDLS